MTGLLGSFLNKKSPESSNARIYALEKFEKYKNLKSSEMDLDVFFAVFVMGLTLFAFGSPGEAKSEEPSGELKNYANDSVFFELGCYRSFLVDLWLYQNKPNLRVKFQKEFSLKFVKCFEKFIGINNLAKLYDERTGRYGKLFREGGEWWNQCRFLLTQLLYRTKNNTTPKTYNFGKEPLAINEDFKIDFQIGTYIKADMPSLTELIQGYCLLLEKNS